MKKLAHINNNALNALTVIMPWLAPLPVAILTATSYTRHLGFVARFGLNDFLLIADVLIGLLIAVVIESLGILSIHLLSRYSDYNAKITTPRGNIREKYRELGVANSRPAWWLIAGYLVVSVTLLVLLEIFPAIATFSLLMFPFVGLSGGALLVLHNAQNMRDSAISANVCCAEIAQTATTATITIAENVEKTHVCKNCQKSFAKTQSLSAHMRHCKNNDTN